jgi:hypothetical protein
MVQYVAQVNFSQLGTPGLAVDALISMDTKFEGPNGPCIEEKIKLREIFPFPIPSAAQRLAMLEASGVLDQPRLHGAGLTSGGTGAMESAEFEVATEDPHGRGVLFGKYACKMEGLNPKCCIVDTKVDIKAKLVTATSGGKPVSYDGGLGRKKATSVYVAAASRSVKSGNSPWLPAGAPTTDPVDGIKPLAGAKVVTKKYRARVEHCGDDWTMLPEHDRIPAGIRYDATALIDDPDPREAIALLPPGLIEVPLDPDVPIVEPMPIAGAPNSWISDYAEFLADLKGTDGPLVPPFSS